MENLELFNYFSTTALPKELPLHLLYEKRLEVPNPSKKLPSITTIYEQILEAIGRVSNISPKTKIYSSNSLIGEDKENDKYTVITPRFQIEFILGDLPVIKDESNLSLVGTFYYKNENTLDINIAFQEYILVCSNGLILEENIIEKSSSISKKIGFERFLNSFINDFSIEQAIKALLKYKKDLEIYITEKEEKEILGDLLRRLHTKNHIVDSNILLAAAKYRNSPDNPFVSKDKTKIRTMFDFLQDFTNFMKTTEISKHLTKHTKLTNYFLETSKVIYQ